MPDGYRLPLRQTIPDTDTPEAIVLALHGMNDYSNAFHSLGQYLKSKNIQLVAYDQRGFGSTEGRGYWHGVSSLTKDLAVMCQLIKQDYTSIPLFILGDSMGGAVILAALDSLSTKVVYDGIILIAPAVWAKKTMPWYQRSLLWISANTFPWMIVTAQGMNITPSDNTQMLYDLGKDPLIIKETRIDTVYGLSNLMDQALGSAEKLNAPTLLLYGERDEIIPKPPVCNMLKMLSNNKLLNWRFILYPEGYHMLTRDLQAQKVYQDIERWIGDVNAGNKNHLNGAEVKDLKRVCGS